MSVQWLPVSFASSFSVAGFFIGVGVGIGVGDGGRRVGFGVVLPDIISALLEVFPLSTAPPSASHRCVPGGGAAVKEERESEGVNRGGGFAVDATEMEMEMKS